MTLVPGDGIGPEATAAACEVIEATGVHIDWDAHRAGAAALDVDGALLPPALITSALECGAVLKGPLATPRDGAMPSPNTALRDALGMLIGVRPCRTWTGTPTPFSDVDLVVIRMTSEDLYAGVQVAARHPKAPAVRRAIAAATGVELPTDAGMSVKYLSSSATLEASRAAMRWAVENGRHRITIVHKASVMPATDGMFLDAARAAAAEVDGLEVDDELVDAVCHQLVRRPERVDVLLCPMLYGDVLSDLCAGITGGLGLAPGASYGPDCAVFEAVHGIATAYAGTGRANPTATILSGAMLLRHLGERDAADRVEAAVGAVIADGRSVTRDLRADGGEGATLGAMAQAVIERLG